MVRPFSVVKRLSNVTYRVQHCNNRRKRIVVHFNRLKPYKQRVPTTVKVRAKVNQYKTTHSHVITLGLSWNWLVMNVRTRLYLPTERTLHKTVEPTVNQTFDRNHNLSGDTLEGYAAHYS